MRKNYFVVLLESDELDGAFVSDELLLEPAPAVPLGVELELDGVDEDDDEDEPPLA